MATDSDTRHESVGQVKRSKGYSYLKRKVAMLRKRVIDYDAETDKMKRAAEREGGPSARFAVDMARSQKFHELSNKLVQAEVDMAGWEAPARRCKADVPFSSMINLTIRRVR